MDGAADRADGIGVEVGKGGELFRGLLVRQWVVEDRLLGHVGEIDVCADVVEVRSIVLAHEEELAAIAKDGGADAALFEAGVLLHDGDVPAVELSELRVASFQRHQRCFFSSLMRAFS